MSNSSISSSDPGGGKRFAWKLCLLLAPFAAWLGFPVAVLAISGELLVSVDSLVRKQTNSDREVLVGLAYSDPTAAFKIRSVQKRDPHVLALGSSRVMQFRGRFFAPEASFYNAGGTIYMAWYLDEFLRQALPDKRVDLILLGVDQWEFNDAWEGRLFRQRPAPFPPHRDPNPLQIIQGNWYSVYQSYREGKFGLRDFPAKRPYECVGLQAFAQRSGFRNDGSHSEGGAVRLVGQADPASRDHGFKDTFRRIAAGTERLEYGKHASRQRADSLVPFLEECRRRGTHVAAFLPPFAPAVWRRLMAEGDKHSYMTEAPDLLRPLLQRYGCTFFDFSDISALGSSDAEFIDGFHGSEKAYLRMLIAMAEQDPAVGRVVDLPKLRQFLRQTEGDCSVFGD